MEDNELGQLEGMIPALNPEPEVKVEPWKIKVGNTDLEFKSAEELNAHYNELLVAAQTKIREAEARAAQLAAAAAPKPEKKAVSDDEFDTERMEALLKTEPKKAFGYAYSQTDEYKQLQAELAQMKQTLAAENARRQIGEFVNDNPDFPRGDMQALQQLDAYRQQLNLPPNAQGLSATWAMIDRQRRMQEAAQQQAPQEQAPANVVPFVPPAPSRKRNDAAQTQTRVMDWAETASLDELRKLVYANSISK